MLPEQHLILLAAKTEHPESQKQEFFVLFQRIHDWNRIIKAARIHGLMPLLHKHISKYGLTNSLPSKTSQKLAGLLKRQAMHNLSLVAVYREIIPLIKEQKIDFIFLKGLHLAEKLYNNPVLRPMIDIDILVKPGDLYRISVLFEGLGASRLIELQTSFINRFLQHAPPFIYKDVLIEIHTSLSATNEPFIIPPEILWEETIATIVSGEEIRVLSPELNFIYLCIHVYKHLRTGKIRLIWFTDLSLLISGPEEFDVEKLTYLIHKTDTLPAIQQVLYFLENYFDQTVPREWRLYAEKPEEWITGNFNQGIMREHEPEGFFLIDDFKRIPGIWNKLRYFSGIVFPSGGFMKKKYKLHNGFLLIFLYPWNALKVFVKACKIFLSS